MRFISRVHSEKLSRLPLFLVLSLALSCMLSVQGCFVAAAGAATTSTAVAVDRRTAGTIVDDQAIELKAMYAIRQQRELWEKSHIHVLSYNNVLLLLGQTPTESFKQAAEQALQDIPKVRRIHNELSVTEPLPLGERSKDAWITTQIKTKLIGTKNLRAHHVKVVTEDRVVYLMGLTTPEEEMTATDIAQTVPGVEKVVQIFESSTTP
ncbi:MAG: BON domain-containing protein [Gammaproteobacteria bacterium]|nr:BON domain-containing protein [Gammaproteobacteria bacterium]MBP9729355.1 BON domain-containing protein [Gammaproteobacteria bacterium]